MLPARRSKFSEVTRTQARCTASLLWQQQASSGTIPRWVCPPTAVRISTPTILHYQFTANGKKLEAKIVSMNAMETSGSGGTAPLIILGPIWMCGQLHVPAALLAGKEPLPPPPPVRTE